MSEESIDPPIIPTTSDLKEMIMAKIKELRDQVEALDAEIRPLIEKRNMLISQCNPLKQYLREIGLEVPGEQPPASPISATHADLCSVEAILKDAGRPLRVAEIRRRLDSAGIILGGSSPKNIRNLLNDSRFQKVYRGTFGLWEGK